MKKTLKIVMIVIIFISLNIRDTYGIDNIVEQGDNFISIGTSGAEIDFDIIKEATDTIYNVLLAIFMGLSVIIGIIIGIKYMISGTEEKAEVKQSLIPYSIAIVIMFGAFSIWKIIIEILG